MSDRNVLSVLVALCTIAGGCGDDDGGGQPLEPTYATMNTILTRSCRFGGSCHGGPTPRPSSNRLNIEIFADDYREALVGVPGRFNDQMYLLMPGDPDASYMWHKINATHTTAPACGLGDAMPRLADEGLPQNERDAIRMWIEMGAPGPDGTLAEVPPPLPGYTTCPERDGGMPDAGAP